MLHQRYVEFTNLLIPTLTKYCQVAPKGVASSSSGGISASGVVGVAGASAAAQPETEQEKSARFVKKR